MIRFRALTSYNFDDDDMRPCAASVRRLNVASVELRDVLKAADPDLHRTAMLIADEAKQGALGGRCYVDALTCQLAIQMLRRHADATFPELPIRGRLSAREIRTVTEFIDGHLDEQLSLPQLAQTVSLSQYHFARRFREATGTTPHRFVTERRVDRAERLLTGSTLPISVVANACGFSDQSHLTRVFQQRFGATPRAVRLRASS